MSCTVWRKRVFSSRIQTQSKEIFIFMHVLEQTILNMTYSCIRWIGIFKIELYTVGPFHKFLDLQQTRHTTRETRKQNGSRLSNSQVKHHLATTLFITNLEAPWIGPNWTNCCCKSVPETSSSRGPTYILVWSVGSFTASSQRSLSARLALKRFKNKWKILISAYLCYTTWAKCNWSGLRN